jgi:hypothetical protein
MLRGSLTCQEEQIHWTLGALLRCLAYVVDAIRADYTLILILLQRCPAAPPQHRSAAASGGIQVSKHGV